MVQNFKKKVLRHVLLIAWLTLVSGHALGQAASPDVFVNRIHVGDFVEIDVIGSIEDDWRGRVDESGYISDYQSIPNPIDVLCRTPAEVVAELTAMLGRTIRDPEVEVRIIDKSGRPLVTVSGSVKVPQRFRLLRPSSVQELIVLTGGLTGDSDGSVEIIRRASLGCGRLPLERENDLEVISLTMEDLIGGKDGSQVSVVAGDVITVKRAPFVTVLGGVRNPQQLRVRSKMTVSRAISSAGGFALKGDSGTVRVYRRTGQSLQTFVISRKDLRQKPESDIEVRAGDILDVPIRGRKVAPPRVADLPASEEIQPLALPITDLD